MRLARGESGVTATVKSVGEIEPEKLLNHLHSCTHVVHQLNMRSVLIHAQPLVMKTIEV